MSVVRAVLLAIAAITGALAPARAQSVGPPPPNVSVTTVARGAAIPPLGFFVMGTVAVAAISPMIASAILGRELTIGEAYHVILGSTLGPVGWLLAELIYPSTVSVQTNSPGKPPQKPTRVSNGRHINIPPSGATSFVANEVLLEFAPGVSAQTRATLARNLQLTQLETQSFALTGRTIERWRIDGSRSAPDTLRLVARNFPGVSAGQANMIYRGTQAQTQPAPKQDVAPDGATQYVVGKLHLLEAHRINNGDDVMVAVIDFKDRFCSS